MAAKSEPSKDPHCPIAKDSRIPADRPRHPWRGRFALRAVRVFLVWAAASFCVGCRTEVAEGRELVAVRGGLSCLVSGVAFQCCERLFV